MRKGGKPVKKLLPILISFTFLLGGCNLFNKNKDKTITDGNETVNEEVLIKERMDDKMVDPKILQSDELLSVGDMQVEKSDPNFVVQNPPSDYDIQKAKDFKIDTNKANIGADGVELMHHSAKNPALHPVFANPKVSPLYGNYAENVIQRAWKYYGTPYEYGSDRSNPSTFDCSDFTRWIYLYSLGMDLPKTSASQWQYVKSFSKNKYTDLSQAKRGDLLFFMSYKGWQEHDYKGINVKAQPVAHCGVYLGNGKMLHTASQKTGGVRVDNIKGTHLEYRFIGGGKVLY